MSNNYKKGPSGVPEAITKATSSFKRHVFWAMLALGSFIIVYIGLMLWFGYHSYILFDAAINKGISPFYSIVAGICIGMLSIFMFKSLFIFKSKREGQDRELKKEEEPELFNYIHKLADEVGAPRPYKIILTARVNASVFYDLNKCTDSPNKNGDNPSNPSDSDINGRNYSDHIIQRISLVYYSFCDLLRCIHIAPQ